MIVAIFTFGLIYILYPSPSSIDIFPPLPASVKSDLEGDTIQNPNIAAYFSNFRRDFITKYYKDFFKKTIFSFLNLPVISLNHPPEAAYKYIRDQQESTFLEEYVHPLRESMFVNGYEPLVQNIINNRQRSDLGDRVEFKDIYYNSKTTIRYYPTLLIFRLLVYLGVWVGLFFLSKFTLRAYKSDCR